MPSLVALLLAALWLLAGYRIYAERASVIAAQEAELNQLVVAVEEQTLRLMRLTEATLLATSRWIEQHPGLYPGQNPSFIELVADLKRLSGEAIEIRVVDGRGGAHVVPATTREAAVNLADSGMFSAQREPRTQGLLIGKPVLGRISGHWIVPVSYPVRMANSEFAAVIAALQLERIGRPLEAQRPKPHGSITLIDTKGITLLRTPAIDGAIGKSIAAAPDFVEHLSVKPRGLYRVKGAFDGVDRLVGFARLADYPLIVAVTASLDDALLPWRRDVAQLLVLMLAVSGFALAFSRRSVRAAALAQHQLADSERRFRTLIEHAPDAILVFDADANRIIDANPMAEKLFEYTRDELLSGGIERFFAPLQPDGLPAAESIRQAQARCFGGESVLIERSLRTASGREMTVEVRIDDISEGGRRLTRGSFIDISQRKAAEIALRESETRLRVLMETSPLPMLIATPPPEGRVLLLNERFVEVIGYTRDDIPDLAAWWPRAYPDPAYRAETRRRWNEAFQAMQAAGRRSLERPVGAEIICKDGSRRFVEIHMSLHADRCLVVFHDLTQRRAYEQELARIAHYDILTDLPNRRLLIDRMEQAIARIRRSGKMLAVCYLDLDEFKPVNDLHGHEAGDTVLVEAARRMSESIRTEDTAARLGGDEFVLLLVDLDAIDECDHVLARMIASLTTPFPINAHASVVLSASIGVSLFPADGETADELLRHADQAMYAAKQAGRNRVSFFAPRQAQLA